MISDYDIGKKVSFGYESEDLHNDAVIKQMV